MGTTLNDQNDRVQINDKTPNEQISKNHTAFSVHMVQPNV